MPRRLELGGRMVTIGRAGTADIVLADPTVSSIHVRIEPGLVAGEHRLIDCHSRNGTRVNGAPVTARMLALDDRIQVGAAVIVYAAAQRTTEAAVAAVAAAHDAAEEAAGREGAAGAGAGGAPRPALSAFIDDEHTTTAVVMAPEDFDIDFLAPRTIPAERAAEAALERRLVGLYRAAKTLTPISDRSPLEPRFVKLVQDVLGVMRVAVVRAPPGRDRDKLEPANLQLSASEVRPGAEPFAAVPPEMIVIRESLRTGRALLYRRPAGRAGEGRTSASSAVVVPIDPERTPGLLAYGDVFEPWPAIHQDDMRLLGILARHAAICLQNQRLQGQLVETNQDLERRIEKRTREMVDSAKLAAVGTLASGIAHEFNNLLAVIMGNVELVQQTGGVPPDANDHLDTVLDAARRSRDIVKHLLLFARRRDPKREPVNLIEIVESTLRLLGSELARAGARLRRSFAALPPVLGQPDQLSLAVLAVVKNARDAIAEKGGGELHVALARRMPVAEGGPAHAVLEVRDTGPGIPAEVRARLFEPFFTTKPLGQGVGLGLSTAYGILKSHGGTIEVESGETPAAGGPAAGSGRGGGATFRLVLPLETACVPEAAMPDVTVESGAPQSERDALHVLIVDDDPAVRSTLAAMVKRIGHMHTVVGSGAEALQAVEMARFDLILLDHGMAGMDGLTARGEILKRLPDQRIVLVTGDADIEGLAAKAGLRAGDFLKKPFGLKQIADLCARAGA